MQRFEVELGVEPESGALRDRDRVVERAVGALRGKREDALRALGMAIASAWSMCPRSSSPIVIVPATTGRLVAVDPQSERAPGQEAEV